MIKPGYKRLGDYIEPLDERNTNLSVKLSQGICNNKYFITPRQVAENSANDKIVRTGQFAYNRATTRNGDKISIAYREGPDCTVSSAYQIFRIKDENKLNPYYLWMWFRRPEFDRYARFKSRGSAHEFFEWDEMCEVYLPIPDIDEQRRIVAEYQAVEKRIATNEALIAQLEETAQAIYKKMFVDDVDTENLTEGWRKGKMLDLFELQRGFDLPHHDRNEGPYPIYASNGITGFHNEYRVKAPGVVTGRSGSIGEVFYVSEDFWPLNTSLWVKDFKKSTPYFVYYTLKNIDLNSLVGGSSAVPTLNRNDVNILDTIIPPYSSMLQFDERCAAIENYKRILYREIATLIDFKVSLLAKLTH